MKKALLIGLVLGLAIGLAVPAMAVDFTASGYIGMRGHVFRNATSTAPVFAPPVGQLPDGLRADETGSFLNSRADLIFTLRASEDLFGQIKFRMDSGHFGTTDADEWAAYGGYQEAVAVQNLFIDFRVPPSLPLWVRVGLQTNFIRGWVFLMDDGPGVSVRTTIEPIKLNIIGAFMKLAEPTDAYTAGDTGELYTVDANIPLSFGDAVNIRPGMFFAYQNMGAYTDSAGYTYDESDLWWIGVYMDGKIAFLNTQLDFVYSGGEIDETTVYGDEVDVDSWLFRGMLSYVWKKLEVGVGGMYVEGEDGDNSDIDAFQLPGAPNYGSECRPVLSDFVVFTGGWMNTGGWPGSGLIDLPAREWPGFWDVRMFAYYQITDWLKVGAQFGYIGDTTDGVTMGNLAGLDALGDDGDDDDSIGWEFDFGVNLQLYKNLSLNTAFGYLIAGDALDLATGSPDDPWALVSRLMYTF